MGRWKKYAHAVMISLLAVLCAGSIPVYAVETGTIASMSEKVYKEKDTGSAVISNVITGASFFVLSTETDEAGNTWCRIRTDVGTEGYMPAQNVALTGSGDAAQAEPADGTAESGEDREGSEDGVVEGSSGSAAETNEDGAVEGSSGSAAETDEDGAVKGSSGSEAETGEDGAAADGSDSISEHTNGNDAQAQGNTDGAGKRIQITETINIRSGASTDTEIVGKIRQGETISYLDALENEIGETWYEIEYNGVYGYIRKDTVTEAETMENTAPGDGENGLLQTQRSEDALSALENGNAQPEEMQVTTGMGGETDEAGNGTGIKRTENAGAEKEAGKTTGTEGEGQIKNSGNDSEEEGGEGQQKDEAGKRKVRFWIDWIVVVSFIGSLLLAAAIVRLVKRLLGIYRRMRQ